MPDDAKMEHERVKLLFDYTKFHLGMYATLGTLLVATLNLGKTIDPNLRLNTGFVWLSVGLIGTAGLAGGVIASSLPHHLALSSFWENPTGPFRLKLMPGEFWTYLEHTAFWLGLGAAVAAFVCA